MNSEWVIRGAMSVNGRKGQVKNTGIIATPLQNQKLHPGLKFTKREKNIIAIQLNESRRIMLFYFFYRK